MSQPPTSRTGEYAERGDYHRELSPDWEFYPTYLAKLEAVRGYLSQLAPETRVLDAGCGEGVLVEEFHGRLRIEGLDPNYSSTHVRQGSLVALPYADGAFDRVLCLDVLEHLTLDDQPRALAELHRVLAPGGELLVTVPNLAHLQSRVHFLLGGRLIRTASVAKHPGDRPIEEYLDLLARAGFRLTDRRGIFPTVPVLTRLIRRRPKALRPLHDWLTRFLPVPGWSFLNVLRLTREAASVTRPRVWMRRAAWVVTPLVAIVVAIGLWRHFRHELPTPPEIARPELAENRRQLFAAVQPVKLSNCTLQRLGEVNDGGYLVCANLLAGAESVYSYGVNGYDGFGCTLSRDRHLRVHQYDCFEVSAPVCPGGDAVFHAECVGTSPSIIDGRPFDSLANQVAKNGDTAKRLILKMDIEGAEWDTFLEAPDAVLERFDQLIVEFHGTQDEKFLKSMARLKQFFHVAHLHFNNYSCDASLAPFPAWAYEVLLVNKRIGVLDPTGQVMLPNPLDAPNYVGPDCQSVP